MRQCKAYNSDESAGLLRKSLSEMNELNVFSVTLTAQAVQTFQNQEGFGSALQKYNLNMA